MRSTAAAALLLCAAPLFAQGPSKPCLDCHTAATIDGHPFAVEYNMVSRFAESKLKSAQTPSGFGSTIEKDLLIEGRVECTSCHVSHAVESKQPSRLRSESVTKLCTACHELQ